MGLVEIRGTLKDSIGNPVTGWLIIQVNAPIYNPLTNPVSVHYSAPNAYRVIDGELTNMKDLRDTTIPKLELLESEEVTYRFEFYISDTVPVLDDPDIPINSDFDLLKQIDRSYPLFEPFFVKVRDIYETGEIEWSDLQHSSISSVNIDTSQYRIAEIVAERYGGTLISQLFIPKGNYSNSTTYSRGDVVYYQSTNTVYWYVNNVPGSGNLPTDETRWMPLIEGAEFDPEAFDPTIVLLDAVQSAWEGVSNKTPTAARLFTAFANVARTNVSTQFTNGLRSLTRTLGDNTDHVATTAFVQAAFNAFTPPPATTAPTIDQMSNSIQIINAITLKRILGRYVRATNELSQGSNGGLGSANTLRNLNTIRNNSVYNLNASANVCIGLTSGYMQLQPGTYLIEGYAASCGTDGTRLDVVDSNGTIWIRGRSEHSGLTGYQTVFYPNNWSYVSGLATFGSITNVGLMHRLQTVGTVTDLGRPSNRGGNEMYAALEAILIS